VQKLKLLYFLTSGPVGVVGSEHEVFAYKGSRLTTKKNDSYGSLLSFKGITIFLSASNFFRGGKS
jgi:hypothetical protein